MKKKLSMFQIILLVTFGGFAIAGILIFAFAIGGGTSNTVGPVKIWGTMNSTAFTAVIRAAADKNPQLNQVSYEQRDAPTYQADLTQALASGTGPDLFLLSQDYAVKDAGEIAPIPSSALSTSQFQNAFVQAADPFISAKGVLGIPVLADPLVLYWNKDMLASAGFSQPPKYWDELFLMSQKITKKDTSGALLKSAVAFGEYENVDNAKDILATLILQAGGPITSHDNGGHLISALDPKAGDGAGATDSALRFYTEFSDPSKDDYSWNRSLPEAQQAFTQGELALYVGYASEKAAIARANPNLNFAVAAIPQIRSAPNALDIARVYAFAASRNGKNPAGAVQVAYLLGSADNSKTLSAALGIPSARRDVLAQPLQGDDRLFATQAIIGHSWYDPDPDATAALFKSMIEDTTSGAVLLTQAVQRADQQMAHILGL